LPAIVNNMEGKDLKYKLLAGLAVLTGFVVVVASLSLNPIPSADIYSPCPNNSPTASSSTNPSSTFTATGTPSISPSNTTTPTPQPSTTTTFTATPTPKPIPTATLTATPTPKPSSSSSSSPGVGYFFGINNVKAACSSPPPSAVATATATNAPIVSKTTLAPTPVSSISLPKPTGQPTPNKTVVTPPRDVTTLITPPDAKDSKAAIGSCPIDDPFCARTRIPNDNYIDDSYIYQPKEEEKEKPKLRGNQVQQPNSPSSDATVPKPSKFCVRFPILCQKVRAVIDGVYAVFGGPTTIDTGSNSPNSPSAPPNNIGPFFTFTAKEKQVVNQSQLLKITYRLVDPDSDAWANIYFDTDNQSFNGVRSSNCMALLRSIKDTEAWCMSKTDNLKPGTYYPYAMVYDGAHQSQVYASQPVVITEDKRPECSFVSYEGQEPCRPNFEIIEPYDDVTINTQQSYTIRYQYYMEDKDREQHKYDRVTFYYDTDNQGFDGKPVTGCVSRSALYSYTCFFNIDGRGSVPLGTYNIYAVVNDSYGQQTKKYATGRITVTKESRPYCTQKVTTNCKTSLTLHTPSVGTEVPYGSTMELFYTYLTDLSDEDLPYSQEMVSIYLDSDYAGFTGRKLLCYVKAIGVNQKCKANLELAMPGKYSVWAMVRDDKNNFIRSYAPGQLTITKQNSIPTSAMPPKLIGAEGSNTCITKTSEALKLLRDKTPEYYNLVVKYIGTIECSPKSGSSAFIYVSEKPPHVVVGGFAEASLEDFAAMLVHESVHSKQYQDFRANNPTAEYAPYESYGGRTGELTCMDVELDALLRLGGSQGRINQIRTLLKTYEKLEGWQHYEEQDR
jgi:hypothetical protein